MVVRTYDIKGELYATYTGIVKISKRPDWDGSVEKFKLEHASGGSEALSIQEVKLEVE